MPDSPSGEVRIFAESVDEDDDVAGIVGVSVDEEDDVAGMGREFVEEYEGGRMLWAASKFGFLTG